MKVGTCNLCSRKDHNLVLEVVSYLFECLQSRETACVIMHLSIMIISVVLLCMREFQRGEIER